jgi:hypothetical protein
VAAQSAVEQTTTQTDSPRVEEKPTVSQTTESAAVQEVSDEFPESQEEQRKAFQQMRQELKALKEAKEETPKESAFDAFRPQQQVTGAPVDPQLYADPISGNVNWQAYNQALKQEATTAARQAAQEMMDEQTARTKHPDLFTNPARERKIADLWFAAKMRGENPTITQVADEYARELGSVLSKAEKNAAEKVLTEVSEKEKAAMAVTSQSSHAAQAQVTSYETEAAMDRVRRGDTDALASLMSKVPWAGR